ncbi:MAG: hypothetical protein IT462_16105 [Planctomycetes bacterium]|nr:hypothetical protein [Planctomycetota bacterium]
MRKFVFVLLLLVACVSVVACGGGTNNAPSNTSGGGGGGGGMDQSTPEGLIALMTAALANVDADKASSYFVEEDRAAMKANFTKAKDSGIVSIQAKFTNLKVTGDEATADMELPGKDKEGKEKMAGPSKQVKMVKKDGKWWSKK